MSRFEAREPECTGGSGDEPLLIRARDKDIGGLVVRRVLPAVKRRMVGPFVFFDHFGPVTLPAQTGVDVRPHPHVHLATVTYLFEGAQVHRDSLGVQQRIEPGAVNWMNAGAGIVHSERSPDDQRRTASPLHGIQAWVALPESMEYSPATFQHVPASAIPEFERDRVRVRVLAGEAWNATSPVRTHSSLFYAELVAPSGGSLDLPIGLGQRALYVVDGSVTLGQKVVARHEMLVLGQDQPGSFEISSGARVMVLGGQPVGPRHLYWNFVASSPSMLDDAKERWRTRQFPSIDGDDEEFIPLPQE